MLILLSVLYSHDKDLNILFFSQKGGFSSSFHSLRPITAGIYPEIVTNSAKSSSSSAICSRCLWFGPALEVPDFLCKLTHQMAPDLASALDLPLPEAISTAYRLCLLSVSKQATNSEESKFSAWFLWVHVKSYIYSVAGLDFHVYISMYEQCYLLWHKNMQLCKYVEEMKSIAVFCRFCIALYVSLCSHSQNGVSYVVSKN